MIERIRGYLGREGLGPLLVRSIGGTAAVSVIGTASTFLLGWLLARGLGAEGYGVYGLVMAVVSVLGIPSQFGLPQLLIREIASAKAMQDWGRLKGVLEWTARVAVISSTVIGVLMVAWALAFESGLETSVGQGLVIASVLVPLIALCALCGGALRGLLSVVRAQVPDGLVRPTVHAGLIAVTLAVGAELNPRIALGTGVVAAAVSLMVGVIFLMRVVPSSVRKVRAKYLAAEWLGAAVPMGMSEGLRVIQNQAAVLALGLASSMGDVGQFRVAASVMAMLVFPISVINLVIAPHISHLSALQDRGRIRKMLAYAALGMTISVILIVLPFFLAGDLIITSVFGAEYAGVNSTLLILSVGMLANAVFGIGASALNMLGHQRRVTRASLLAVLTLCALLWPAIDGWGNIGAAVAVSVSMTLWSAILWYDARVLESLDLGVWAIFNRSIARRDG